MEHIECQYRWPMQMMQLEALHTKRRCLHASDLDSVIAHHTKNKLGIINLVSVHIIQNGSMARHTSMVNTRPEAAVSKL